MTNMKGLTNAEVEECIRSENFTDEEANIIREACLVKIPEMYGGEVYTWICPTCQQKVTDAKCEIIGAIERGCEDVAPDLNHLINPWQDAEAPLNMVADRRQMCAGSNCSM